MSAAAWLFWGLVATQCLLPFTDGNAMAHVALRLLTVGVLLLGVRAVADTGRSSKVGLAIALPSALMALALPAHCSPALVQTSLATGMLFDLWLAAVLLRHLMREPQAGSDSVYLAMVVYMLAWLVFGTLFLSLEIHQPGSFQGQVSPEGPLPIAMGDALYFSMSVLTTAGFGEIVPVSGLARSLVSLESVFGVLYPCVLISRLVAASIGELSCSPMGSPRTDHVPAPARAVEPPTCPEPGTHAAECP